MKENILSLLLIGVETCLFYFLSYFFGISNQLAFKELILWVTLSFALKHYKIESTLVWDEISKLCKIFLSYCIVSIIFIYPDFHCLIVIMSVGFFMLLGTIVISRTFRIMLRNVFARKTLVIGTGNVAFRVGMIANNNRFALTDVIGFVKMDDSVEIVDSAYERIKNKRVYSYRQLDKILKTMDIDQIIIALPNSSKEMIDEISKKIFDKVKIVKIVPDLDFTVTFNSKINDFDGVLLISTARGKLGRFEKILKRCVDICAGLVGCTLLLPLTFYVKYKNNKNGDNDPIFFKQERIGLDGKPIYIYKYRSMIPNAEQVLEELMEKDPAIKEEYLTNKKLVNDPRITDVGHFLRKTSLDEFPQFINVLRGEMSLVGPRPYLPREKEDMDIYYESIIRCKPGITGMWQANGRSDVGFIDRCKFDDYYYRNWNFGLDMIIVYKTIKSVIYGKGAL